MKKSERNRNCASCVGILIDYQIKHTEDSCPLRASLHCNYCCKYGHATNECPVPPPDSVYTTNIGSAINALRWRRAKIAAERAAATEKVEKDSVYYPAKELLENEKVLREFVRARIGIPAVKIEENKKRIRVWADKQKIAVRYIADVGMEEDKFAEYDRYYAAANPRDDAQTACRTPQTNTA